MLAQTEGQDLADWPTLLAFSAREVFRLMLNEELLPVDESTALPENQLLDITAMVGLAGQVCGMIAVRCPMDAANLIAARMLGLENAEERPETWDALGEICNMVAGNFKNKITGMADGCMISVPTVVTGENYSIHSVARNKRSEVHLRFRNLPIVVAIEVHPRDEARH